MRPPRSLATAATLVVLSLSVLTGCGGGSDDADTSGDGGDGGDGGTSQSAAPAEPAGGESEDSGEGGEGGEDSASGFADCTAITAEEMAPVLGEGTGTAEVPPGGGGCTYSLDDPRQPSVFLEQFGTDDFADGFGGAKANISNTAIGPIENATETDVTDVGDGAKVTVGDSVGGTSLQSIGLVLVGDTIVRASVLQAIDLDQAALLQLTTDILTLIAGKG